MNAVLLNNVKKLLLILLGNTIYALSVVMFIMPNNLIVGGSTGIALFFQHMYHIPVTIFVSCFNIFMFVMGFFFLGKKFAVTTLVSTFYYPFILAVFQKIPELQGITEDRLLSIIFSGIMIGLGIGIVIKAGASTGGLDIPPLILNKKFGLPISVVLYVLDFSILLLQMLFADREQVLYGILVVLIYTVVLDKVLLTGKTQIQVKIVSEKFEEINRMISSQMDRGSTLFYAETGHFRHSSMVVLTVIGSRELPKLNQMVLAIDPTAFMVINQVNEVKGRGFTTQKIYK